MVLFLIGFDVAARLLLHVPNVSPVAASALFAGVMLRHRSLALAVPLAAMPIGDTFAGFYDGRVMAVVYAAMALPAAAGILARRYRVARVIAPTVVACSLIFFATTNLAVWAFSGMYSLDMAGLVQCYVAALPFLKYTLAGDLFWAAVLFGGAWLVRRLTARSAIAGAASRAGAGSGAL
ncbi:MAG: hypothetical protein QOF09_4225 [Alphaproteobacteria bacterium]|nr:hypothetical protein [Alphaproteobacteria bacterium]